MRLLFVIAPWISALLSFASTAADGEKYAFLVGVSSYRSDSGLNNLQYAEADMTALKAALLDVGFKDRNIRLMVKSNPDERFNPRLENIKKELHLLLDAKRPEDVVLVAFAGHGLQYRDKDNAYFCPSDANVLDARTWLDLTEILAQLKECPAGGKLLIADCCRDDPRLRNLRAMPDNVQSVTRPQTLKLPQSVAAIFSCRNGEFAHEEEEFKGGVFTHFLIQGIKGDAALNGEVEIKTLASYLERNVYDYVSAKRGVSQRPACKVETDQPLILARVKQELSEEQKRALRTLGARKAQLDLDEALKDVRNPTKFTDVKNAADPKTLGTTVDLGKGVKLELVRLRAGTFQMGSPVSEPAHLSIEEQHEVTLTRDFLIGKYEVTQEQWQAVMGANPSRFVDPKNPVDNLTWNEAKAFCKKLSALTGKDVRLPTEAQWEYACRAGTTTPFNTGEQLTTDQANFYGDATYNGSPKGENRKRTTNVGSFKPNAWGLYDMHGNVYEWCEDYYEDKYFLASPKNDPTGPATGEKRVVRGGSWMFDPWEARTASRYGDAPDTKRVDTGLRVVIIEP